MGCLTEKVLGLGQRRGGVGSPPPFGGGVGSPPPLQPPKLSNTPRGHTLAGGGPRGTHSMEQRELWVLNKVPLWPSCLTLGIAGY